MELFIDKRRKNLTHTIAIISGYVCTASITNTFFNIKFFSFFFGSFRTEKTRIREENQGREREKRKKALV